MKGHILVVDDEEVTRQTVGDILRLEGYQVTTTKNGEAALESLRANDFDLMLLDLKMPGIDGVEVMRQSAQLAPDTQIVLLTAHGSLESAIEAIRHEVHDYLLKPVTLQQLLGSVASGIARRAEVQRRRLLLGRMENSLRKLMDAEGTGPESQYDASLVSIIPGVVIDLWRREIWRENERVSLTPTEGKLMRVFLENRGRVLSHQEIVGMTYGYEVSEREAPEVLRPVISRLRRKLRVFAGERWIVSIRGTGYVFDTAEKKRGTFSTKEDQS